MSPEPGLHKVVRFPDTGAMSMQPVYPDERFAFDRYDRMRRALRVAGMTNLEMADYLEVSSNTVGNWLNGRAWPRPRELKRFALRTGFPIQWLETGTIDPDGDGIPGESPKITER